MRARSASRSAVVARMRSWWRRPSAPTPARSAGLGCAPALELGGVRAPALLVAPRQLVDLGLQRRVVLRDLRLAPLERLLQRSLVGVQSLVAAHRILDDVADRHAPRRVHLEEAGERAG